MNIVVGISHPKQVYMFKNLVFELKKRKHKILIILVDKEISSVLLDEFDFNYTKIGINQKSIIFKIVNIFQLTIKTFLLSLKFKPDIFIGQAIPHIAYTSFVLRKPYIIFEDTENSRLLQKIVNPFASTIVTPNSFRNNLGNKQIKINGSFELAYLRKNWFNPDVSVLSTLGLKQDDTFTIVRFVSWNANHDIGHNGISSNNKILLVKEFEKFGKVFISSEVSLPEELEHYRFKLKVSQMHSLMFYASLVYGESASMAAESAYLGTPSIYLDNEGRGYTEMLSKHKLVYNFIESEGDQIKSIKKGTEILSLKNNEFWNLKAEKMINEKIDVSSYMIWFIENYPESHKIMKENPEYQESFR